MNKQHILDEIRRTASENGGVPLGARTFEQQTGIRHGDWFGKHWRSWGDAVREAGLKANTLTPRIPDEELLERYALLARALGRAPVKGDLRLAKRRDPTFPSDVALTRRYGTYQQLRSRTYDYCASRADLQDILVLLKPAQSTPGADHKGRPPSDVVGYVYLLKSGRYFKIGKTNSVGRRERELAIQLPEEARRIHSIKTDDPNGIEAYWHARFAAKRAHGEWFELNAENVAAFKRRKF